MVTTIQIDEKLKAKLDAIKVHRRETYNELIERLMSGNSLQNVDRESLIATIEVLSDPELMRGIGEALEEERKGSRGKTLEELEKEFRINV